MSYNYVVDHALKNVWCTPEQDRQYIFAPYRISRENGCMYTVTVMDSTYDLPDQTHYWHVFQIGQLHPLIVNLLPKTGEWVSFADAMASQDMIANIYTDTGIELPRFDTWYQYSTDKDLIVAIRTNTKIPIDFNNDQIYVRIYSNEFFRSVRSQSVSPYQVKTNGRYVTSVEDIVDIQTEFNTYSQLMFGYAYAFVNGYKTNTIDPFVVQVGDYVEYVFDSSILKVVKWRVGDLPFFKSTLDSKMKYLLHYPNDNLNNIEYQDDVDFYITEDIGNSRSRGVFYHRNNEDACRMVTHRDYSIVTQYIDNYNRPLALYPNSPHNVDTASLYIEAYIRQSGYQRPLVYESNRINELYKLSDTDLVRALIGLDSTPTCWKANNLEQSWYTFIMRTKCCYVTPDVVQDAYGYNALSSIIGMTPSSTYTSSGKTAADVPYMLQTGCTVYEYDSDGLLLGWYYHVTGSRYFCANQNASKVEMISGLGGKALSEYQGMTEVTLPSYVSYRVYKCTLVNNIPDRKWVLADSSEYTVDSGVWKWISTDPYTYPMLRTDSKFLATDIQVNCFDGVVDLSLYNERFVEGNFTNEIMDVPMGELDVFINGRSLIKDINYKLNFPRIIIQDKNYLNMANGADSAQNIHIRFTGFCDSSLNVIEADDTGFIQQGMASVNSKFNLRDDKVQRIVLDGKLQLKSELSYIENDPTASSLDSRNGLPYMVRDMVVPMRGLVPDDTYELRNQSKTIDTAISNYLSLKLPQETFTKPSVAKARYYLYSPFVSCIITSLVNGNYYPSAIKGFYNDMTMKSLVENSPAYKYLSTDPTQSGNALPSEFVYVFAHPYNYPVELDMYQYMFVQRVVSYYCNGLINLSDALTIKPI